MTASNVSLTRGRSGLKRLLCGNLDNKVSRPDTSDRTGPVTQRYGSEARRKVERPARLSPLHYSYQRRGSALQPRSPHPAFPKLGAHAPNTTQTPSRSSLSFVGRMQQRLWSFLRKLKDADFRYSLKVGISTAILAAPAFIDYTRPTFVQYRGEWALISFFVVMGQTIGAVSPNLSTVESQLYLSNSRF